MKTTVNLLWNALLTATVVTMLAGLFVAAMPPVYRATATVKGPPDGMLIIRSGDLLAEAMKTTGVNPDDLLGWLEEWSSAQVDGTTLLQQKLFVQAGEHENWIDITVEAQVAQSATDLANEIARAYLARVARNALTTEVKTELFSLVEKADLALVSFLQAHPVATDFNGERIRLNQHRDRLGHQLRTKAEQGKRITQQMENVRKRDVGGIQDGALVRALGSRDRLKLQAAELASRYGSQHQKMITVRAQLAAAEDLLDKALESTLSRMSEQHRTVKSELAAIERQIEQADQSIVDLDLLQVEHEKLKLTKQSALDKFNGMTEGNRKYEFAEAIPPDNSLGFNQLVLVGLIFAVTFLLVILLTVFRGKALIARADVTGSE